MRCALCPVPAGRPCWGEVHGPACDRVADGQPGRAAQLVEFAGAGPGDGRPAPEMTPAMAAPAPADVRLAMLADTCPHGSGPCGCGAAPRLCSRPDRPGEVWRADCLRCVAAPARA